MLPVAVVMALMFTATPGVNGPPAMVEPLGVLLPLGFSSSQPPPKRPEKKHPTRAERLKKEIEDLDRAEHEHRDPAERERFGGVLRQ